MTNADSFLETDLPGKLGVSLDQLREIRSDMLEGKYWQRGKKGAVLWTPEGVEKLCAFLNVSNPFAEKKGPLEADTRPQRRTLYMLRTVLNTRIVLAVATIEEAKKNEATETFRVRVKDSAAFCRGNSLECRHVQADLYEFVGVAPRRRRA